MRRLLLPFLVLLVPADGMVASSRRESGQSFSFSRREALHLSSKVSVAAAAAGVAAANGSPSVASALADAPPAPAITHRVKMQLRIAEVLTAVQGREGLPAEDGVIEVGLYGKASPEIVNTFLSYCVPSEVLNEATGEIERQPSLSQAQFWRMEPGVEVEAGKIRGLNEVSFGGTTALEFGKRIYPTGRLTATELERLSKALSHDKRGLLTRSASMVGPEFAVTLAEAPQLDGTSAVFGRVLEGEAFLDKVEGIQVYTYGAAEESGPIADKIFRAQKAAYTEMAKNMKDQRFDDLRGKLLRKVEIRSIDVTPVGEAAASSEQQQQAVAAV